MPETVSRPKLTDREREILDPSPATLRQIRRLAREYPRVHEGHVAYAATAGWTFAKVEREFARLALRPADHLSTRGEPDTTEQQRIAAISKLAASYDATPSDVNYCVRKGLDLAAAREHLEFCGLNKLAADPTSRIGAKIRAMRALREKKT